MKSHLRLPPEVRLELTGGELHNLLVFQEGVLILTEALAVVARKRTRDIVDLVRPADSSTALATAEIEAIGVHHRVLFV